MFIPTLYSYFTSNVLGIPPPSVSDHSLYLDLEPTFGNPVSYHVRFQVNLLLERDPAFPPLRNITAPGTTVLPMFWAQEGFQDPGRANLSLMWLVLNAHWLGAYVLAGISLGLAVVLVAVSGFCFVQRRFGEKRRELRRRESVVSASAGYDPVPSDEIRMLEMRKEEADIVR